MYTALIMLLFAIPWWLMMLTTLSMLISYMEILFCVMSVQACCLSFYVRFWNFVCIAFIWCYAIYYLFISFVRFPSLISLFVLCVFAFLIMSFVHQNCFILMKSNLQILTLMFCSIFLNIMMYVLMFSSKSFISITFRYMVQFEFFFV